MDAVDLAQRQQECLDDLRRREKRRAGPLPTGYCLNCGEPVANGLRWCCLDCRDDWERLDAVLRERGL